MQEYKFKITIDGVYGTLRYSVDAESEQEARDYKALGNFKYAFIVRED